MMAGSDKVEIGKVLSGRYRLDALLGAGGMGRVFRGYHLELKIPVAVKVMHQVLALDPELSRRFEREARAAMMLAHPNVVRVLDLGHEGETKFIVMEYIEGRSLGQLIDQFPRGRAPLAVVVDLLAQTADALAAAHAKGLVHRDLKPDNIIVSEVAGVRTARVLDFGLVKMTDPEAGGTLTQADQVAGTPAYMSPEQCRSLAVGPSADLYSLGCILHEMLSGEPPFSGASAIDIIARQMFLPAPPTVRAAEAEPVPPDLEALRKELLGKQPEDRPRDAATVAVRLRAALRANTTEPPPPAVLRGSRPPRGSAFPIGTEPAIAPLLGPQDELSIVVLRLAAARIAPNLGDELIVALGAQGVRTTLAEGVADFASQLPDVGVIDGGTEVAVTTRSVREIVASAPDVPILAVLASLANDELSLLIEAGAGDVTRGVLDVEGLAKKIRRLARRRRRS